MRLINYDDTIFFELRVFPCFGKQHTVSHKFDSGAFIGLVVKSDLIANKVAVFLELCGYTCRNGGCGHPTWLGAADKS